MGKIVINDDDAFEILDYLIQQDRTYADYLAYKIFVSIGLNPTFNEYRLRILDEHSKSIVHKT